MKLTPDNILRAVCIIGFIAFACYFARAKWRDKKQAGNSQPKQGRISFTFSVQRKAQRIMNAKVRITSEQKIPVLAKFTTIAGIVAAIIGVPAWKSSDESVAIVQPDETGNGATVVSVGEGTATISMHAEGDAEAGVDPLDDSFEVEVIAPEAAVATISIGTATLKDAPVHTPENPVPNADGTLPPPV